MKQFLFILTTLILSPIVAQQTVSLQECYGLVSVNYPLTKQTAFLKTQNQLDTDVISIEKLPKFSIDAQATYQSDVIEIPIPNSNIEPLNKDQYRATLSVNQLIYNGGLIDASLNVKSAQLKTKQKEIEVSLYQLKLQVNNVYFSILLSQESYVLAKAKETQLLAKLKEIKSGIKHGVLLPASDKILEAELLKINQQLQEIASNKTALIETLSSLIGTSLDTTTTLKNPLVEIEQGTNLTRPELELFQFKKEEIESSETLLSTKNSPKLYGFAQGGYGNPGLNMLDNSFQPFYTVGVKLNWHLFDWNSNKKQRESLTINKDIIDNEAAVFKLNTNIALNNQRREIEKTTAFIDSDLEIIKLRKEVLQSSSSQLKNGVITSSAYITELTNLYVDENALLRHKIQLQLAKANYNIIKGQ